MRAINRSRPFVLRPYIIKRQRRVKERDPQNMDPPCSGNIVQLVDDGLNVRSILASGEGLRGVTAQARDRGGGGGGGGERRALYQGGIRSI
jgi:hypothetical protein